ncbi:phospholipase A and acyltransferase 5 isoform X3 [Camelus bactrianus]|uniref:Phospholipase A and acyltransferase 5 isoform X3 n=1 Tax=Camelus bactrianus TaxID=9837 RepID=A0AC58R088_CAMBA
MGLSPAAGGDCGRRFPRFPRPRLKAASRTASIRPNDSQPAPGHSAVPQSGRHRNEAPLHRATTPRPGTPLDRSPCPSRPSDPQQDSMGSHALVQLMPKQPQPGTLEQSRSSVQQGEKPMVNLEPTPNQRRAEWNSTRKPGSAGRLTKQAAERHWGLNRGPCARQACMLPLSHTSPNSCMCFLVGLLSHNFT